MRKLPVFITLLALLVSLAFCASAAPAAKSVNIYGTVSVDGSCQMTQTVTVRLDQPADALQFPLPGNASNIMLNGSHVFSRTENGVRYVNLSGAVGKTAGEFTLTFTYSLPNLVSTNEAGLLQLQLPMLSGFVYPVQNLEFSITMPGPITVKPAFSSGYHQANIEKDLYCVVSGATISGTAQVELKDHETLAMTLTVSEEMFPQNRIEAPDFKTLHIFITVFSVLAALYYLLFLRCLPTWPRRQPTPPEGLTAGQLHSVLHLKGADLSLMVFTWAQLGYLLIRLDHAGRVTLHRQMDMGNERSAFEQRCFKLLFGNRSWADTASLRYVQVCQQIQKMKPNLAAYVHPKSGNLQVFRALAAIPGLFCGISVGLSLSGGAALQWFLVFLVSIFGLLSCWYIQSWAMYLLAPQKRPLWIRLGLCGIWLLLGISSKTLPMAAGLVTCQLFAGILLAFGGRRTFDGRHVMAEILGHRRYLQHVKPEKLRFIHQSNPDYFHQMAPYALALSADKTFAKAFGNLPIGPCPYIAIGTDTTMRASQWASIMRRALRAMNDRAERSTFEKLLRILKSLIK